MASDLAARSRRSIRSASRRSARAIPCRAETQLAPGLVPRPQKDQITTPHQRARRVGCLTVFGGDPPFLNSCGSVSLADSTPPLLSRDCQGAVAMVNPQNCQVPRRVRGLVAAKGKVPAASKIQDSSNACCAEEVGRNHVLGDDPVFPSRGPDAGGVSRGASPALCGRHHALPTGCTSVQELPTLPEAEGSKALADYAGVIGARPAKKAVVASAMRRLAWPSP